MKKTLVLLALALVLCMACGVAAAEIAYQKNAAGEIEHEYDITNFGDNIGYALPCEENGRVVNGYVRFKCRLHNDPEDVNDFKDFPIFPSNAVYYTYDEVKDNLDDTTKVKAYQLPSCDPAVDGWITVLVNEEASQMTNPVRGAGQTWIGWEGPRTGEKKLTKADVPLLQGGHLASNVARFYGMYGYDEPQYTDGSKLSTCSEKGELNVYCLRCKEKIETIILQENPAKHTSPKTIDIAPTCSTKGHFRYYCEACGKDIDPENQPETFAPSLAPDDPNTIHSDEGFYTKIYVANDPRNKANICDKDDDPTKTQDEVKVYFNLCADCNYRLETIVTTPWHHTWSAWEYTQEPTCVADGTLKRTCKDCGKEQQYPGYQPETAEEKEELDKKIKHNDDAHPIYEVICEGFVNTEDVADPWDDAQVTEAQDNGLMTKSTAIWDNGMSCQLRVLDGEHKLVRENQDYYFIYRCSLCHEIARVAVKTAAEHKEIHIARVPGGTCKDEIIKNNADRAFDWTDVECSVCGEVLADPIKGAEKKHTVAEGTWRKTVEGGEGNASNWMGICTVCGDVVNLVTYGDPNNPSDDPVDPEDPEDPEDPVEPEYTANIDTMTPNLAVISYAPVDGKICENLCAEVYMLSQGTDYFGMDYSIPVDGNKPLKYNMQGAFGFAIRLYDGDTGETLYEYSKFFE